MIEHRDEPFLEFFTTELAPHHEYMSQPYAALAVRIVSLVPPGPRRAAALRQLLRSRDQAFLVVDGHRRLLETWLTSMVEAHFAAVEDCLDGSTEAPSPR